ncbi:MAG: hypothetical protein EA397_01615 [Deltaproteobacteria bacterium]|nr:MAG: hypothetical protein EA397_01615 [Deltaproteobacteria bacterium]
MALARAEQSPLSGGRSSGEVTSLGGFVEGSSDREGVATPRPREVSRPLGGGFASAKNQGLGSYAGCRAGIFSGG